MNLRQLRYVQTVAHNGFSISRAAESLHTAQPGISTQIRLLEEELGVPLFQRSGKRLVGLTEAGEQVAALAQEILHQVTAIGEVAADLRGEACGTLTIATTHTQARYALPPVVHAFRQRYPQVKLRLRQGNPSEVCRMALAGEADFAIATEAMEQFADLVMLPCYRWNRCVVAPHGHPILEANPLSLEAIAACPVITYDFAFTGRSAINKAFARAGLELDVVLTAVDSDVLKTYVRMGLGIGLLANMAYSAKEDTDLVARDAGHLFEESTTRIGFRRGRFLREYMYAFMALFAPYLEREVVDRAAAGRP